MLWQPFHLKQCMTHKWTHHETERQRSINNIWSCILGNQGFTQMNQLITELLTSVKAKNTMYNRKNMDSKMINGANCKRCNMRLFAVEYLILLIYHYPTAKTRTLYKSTDGPAGRPTDNPPNSDGLGVNNWTVPELMVQVYEQPRPPIWQGFGSNLDMVPKWRSGTVANTMRGIEARRGVIGHRGVSDGSDGTRPLWWSDPARTEFFFANVIDSYCKVCLYDYSWWLINIVKYVHKI